MTPDILEAFESDSINFTVYAVQIEGKAGQSKMTTRELKEKQGVTQKSESLASSSQRRQSIIDVRKQTTEISTLQRRLELLTRKEARITQLCRNHEDDKKDANYQKFYDSVKAVATSGGKFKKTVNMITSDGSHAKDDLMSVYSFEYDPSNMKYTTGAAGINKLDAPIEEGEEIDEDLDSPIETPKPIAPPPSSSGSKKSTSPPSAAAPSSTSSKTSSKTCTIM
jgi:hypothetical protein